MDSAAPDIRVFPDLDSLSSAAAAALVERGRAALKVRGIFRLALNGGGSPQRLFEILGSPRYRSLPLWQSTAFFWGDERLVPPHEPGSNYKQAQESFLASLGVLPERVHRIRGELQAGEAARAYARLLKREADPGLDWPRFDLVLLGLGVDGHTASLFPGSPPAPSGVAVQAVSADYDGRPAGRITLTPQVFNSARALFWIVPGAPKAGIVKRVLRGEPDPAAIPAQRINLAGGTTTWWLDEASASKP